MKSNNSQSEGNDGPRLDVKAHSLSELVRKMWEVIRPLKLRLAVGCFLIAIAGGIYGVMPLFAKELIDRAIPEQNIRLAMLIAGAFLMTHFVRISVWYLAM